MIHLKNKEEILLLKKSSILVSKTLGVLAKEIRPGIHTVYLDRLAKEYICDNGGKPAFLGLYGFPNTICASLNNDIVHGLPNKKYLKEGDLLSIDCGVIMNGYCGDQAYTFSIGEITSKQKHLLNITKKSLYRGIKSCLIGGYIGDIGYNIQKYVEDNSLHIVKDLVGHGIGRKLHEDPYIPNYGLLNTGEKIINGMVLSIEPMVNIGTDKIKYLNDGWTITTFDGSLSAHYEHNVAVFNNCTFLLSTYKYVNLALGIEFDKEESKFYDILL